jgi:hypothetical protein
MMARNVALLCQCLLALCGGVVLADPLCTVTGSLGCYVDNISARVLPNTVIDSGTGDKHMSQEYCAGRVASIVGPPAMSGVVVGVEYGGQCFYGPSVPTSATKKPDGDCSMKCLGAQNETCGGDFRIQVFTASCVKGPDVNPHTCASEPALSSVWCDHTCDTDTRVAALIAALRPSEKAGLLVNGASAVPRLGLPAYNWWSEALHGVARDGVATSFPQIIGVSSSYNTSLFKMLGELSGTEARGKNNALSGATNQGLTMWAPNVNIFRDPRWGRGQETPGEDPCLNGAYAENYVGGMQGDESSNGYLRASACLKHYAACKKKNNHLTLSAFPVTNDY